MLLTQCLLRGALFAHGYMRVMSRETLGTSGEIHEDSPLRLPYRDGTGDRAVRWHR
jgi:hypothetical protein